MIPFGVNKLAAGAGWPEIRGRGSRYAGAVMG